MPFDIDKIEKFLKDVDPSESFWVNKGPVIRNIYELANAIENISDDTFEYHVNEQKNDFSEWVRNVLNDNELADCLFIILDKNKTIKKIKERIAYFERELDKSRKRQVSKGKEITYFELVIGFALGLIVGAAIGIIVSHYSIIPKSWF